MQNCSIINIVNDYEPFEMTKNIHPYITNITKMYNTLSKLKSQLQRTTKII